MNDSIVIVGAGQAGIRAAETLRQAGYDDDLFLIGEEPFLPYQRPPLSKTYLKGEVDEEQLFLRPATFFERLNIEFKSHSRVAEIELDNHHIVLDSGARMPYGKLLLTTGTRARQIPVPGKDLRGVFTLRSMGDVPPIRDKLDRADDIVIIGGGYIGMEFAAVAASVPGRRVTVIESRPRILERSVAPEISHYIQNLHHDHGVNFALGDGVVRLMGTDHVSGVELTSGEVIPAGMVLVAVGAEPVTELVEAAGIAVDGGICVDAACHTSARDVFAAGDCTIFPSARYNRAIRLESVQNANEQAKAAALSMLGESVAYDPVPWFWSDQFDMRLQIAGLSTGYDRTELDGNPDDASFALRYFKNDKLLAADTINAPRIHMMSRKALASVDAEAGHRKVHA